MLALNIARRYLLSRKSHSAVNIICGVAIGGVSVAIMAIVVVLSVFNGFASLAEKQMGLFDADLRVEPAAGKTIACADSLAARVAAMPQVAAAVPVIDERALAVSPSAQMPVRLKGVGGEEAAQALSALTAEDEQTQADRQAQKLARRMNDRQKLMNALVRRGYDFAVARRAAERALAEPEA